MAVDFIQESGIVMAMVGLLQAPPGTRLHDRLASEGRLLLDQISGDNADGTTNVIPVMGVDALRAGYSKLLKHIYSPENYYRRIKTLLRTHEPSPISVPLDVPNLMALFRSIVWLGIIGRDRLHYWDLLVWTLVRHRRQFSKAVTLAIWGYHFRTICERHLHEWAFSLGFILPIEARYRQTYAGVFVRGRSVVVAQCGRAARVAWRDDETGGCVTPV